MDLEALVAGYLAQQPGAGRPLALELRKLVLPVFRGRFDEVDVEDLTQETIAVVLRDLDTFESRGRGSFKAWVRTIARNRKLAHASKQARSRVGFESSLDEIVSGAPGPREQLHWRERLAVVIGAFELIDPKFRSALEFLVSGGDPAELAEHLNLKPQSVRTRASRALMALRMLVSEQWQTSAQFFSTPR